MEKSSPAKWGSGFLFLHQRRRPRQTASKEAVEKNVGDLNETLKWLPRIVSLWILPSFFLIMLLWSRCAQIHRMFCFYDCSWPSAGL